MDSVSMSSLGTFADGLKLPSAHPMDDIPVRRLNFALEDIGPGDVVWSRTDPQFSVFINALGLHVPHFERYLCRALAKGRSYITDPGLVADVDAIIGQEGYRRRMIVEALVHIAAETMRTYWHMARVDGWIRGPVSAVRQMGYCTLMLSRLLHRALPVFRRSYHPRRHPLVTDAQNAIQVAWRRYALNDGDVLKLDHARMARMMNIADEASVHAA